VNKQLFRVIRGGAQMAYRGFGRRHTMHTGLTEGGVMDKHAASWANRLLTKRADSPLFEITLGNVELEIQTQCQIAITGADLGLTRNGEAIQAWRTLSLKRGDSLNFAFPSSGLRAYLAIHAEISMETEQVLGDNLDVSARGIIPVGVERTVPKRFLPDYDQPLILDVMPGYQFQQFSESCRETLISERYSIQANSSRMAYRLKGRAIDHSIQSLYSQGMAYGAIQIPPDGQPVVLLNDRQTMGGYPLVGCITQRCGSELAQRMTPSQVQFRFIDIAQASKDYQEQQSFFANDG